MITLKLVTSMMIILNNLVCASQHDFDVMITTMSAWALFIKCELRFFLNFLCEIKCNIICNIETVLQTDISFYDLYYKIHT